MHTDTLIFPFSQLILLVQLLHHKRLTDLALFYVAYNTCWIAPQESLIRSKLHLLVVVLFENKTLTCNFECFKINSPHPEEVLRNKPVCCGKTSKQTDWKINNSDKWTPLNRYTSAPVWNYPPEFHENVTFMFLVTSRFEIWSGSKIHIAPNYNQLLEQRFEFWKLELHKQAKYHLKYEC